MITVLLITSGLVAVAVMVGIYACLSVRSSLLGRVYWRGRSDKNQIAITFDDGPHPQFTRAILQILEREKVSATFFLVGKKLEAFPDVAKEISAAGHELGFHGFTHTPLWMKLRPTLDAEVNQSRDAFRKVLGFEPVLFRPPYGVRGPYIMKIARRLRWRTVNWTRAGWDWTHIPGEEVARRALKNTRAGNILLLHDSDGPNLEADRRRTVEALGIIIRELKRMNFEFARVSEMLPEA